MGSHRPLTSDPASRHIENMIDKAMALKRLHLKGEKVQPILQIAPFCSKGLSLGKLTANAYAGDMSALQAYFLVYKPAP
jgi:hypothetical protein